eukprot:3921185-Rhodomonas_salina.2
MTTRDIRLQQKVRGDHTAKSNTIHDTPSTKRAEKTDKIQFVPEVGQNAFDFGGPGRTWFQVDGAAEEDGGLGGGGGGGRLGGDHVGPARPHVTCDGEIKD